jgi:Uncharacterized alpha/beta hydrolase domain (DUF2235)
MAADQFPAATQNAFTLSQAADLADKLGAPVCSAAPAGQARPSMASRASQLMSANDKTDVRPSCQQSLNLTFYFDGTGNNRDADIGTGEHSNVARMFLAHQENEKSLGRYKFYIPALESGPKFFELPVWQKALDGEGLARGDFAQLVRQMESTL